MSVSCNEHCASCSLSSSVLLLLSSCKAFLHAAGAHQRTSPALPACAQHQGAHVSRHGCTKVAQARVCVSQCSPGSQAEQLRKSVCASAEGAAATCVLTWYCPASWLARQRPELARTQHLQDGPLPDRKAVGRTSRSPVRAGLLLTRQAGLAPACSIARSSHFAAFL